MPVSPSERNRSFSSVYGVQHASPGFLYLWDPTLVVSGTAPNGVTGGWYAASRADFAASINVSGLNLTVGSVAVTGGSIAISNTPNVTVINPIAVTGTHPVTVTNPLSVTGSVTIAGGSSNGTVAVTGNPGFTVVNALSVTGLTVSTTSGPIAVTGGQITATVINPLAITGLTVNATINTVAVTGTVTAIDSQSRALLSGISGLLASNLSDPAWITGQVSVTNTVATVDTQGNALLSGISGLLGTNLAAAAWVTGQVSVNNPVAITGNVAVAVAGPISVTGLSVGVSNPVGVTGTAVDSSLPAIGGFAPRFLPIGGKVVMPSGAGSITGYNSTGDMAMLNISQQNGGLLVLQGCLEQNQDFVTAFPPQTGTASSHTVSGIANGGWGTALGNNPNRRAWYFQNLSTGTMYLRFSAVTPTSGNAHVVLKGCTTQNDGNGASWSDSPAIWTGPVSVSGYFGVTPTYTCWEM